MKYITLYEAFESSTISKVNNFLKGKIGRKESAYFVKYLTAITNERVYNIPLSKINDDDVEYLSAKKAFPINSEERIISNENPWGIYCLKFWFSLDKGYIGFTGVGNRKCDFNSIKNSITGESERKRINQNAVNYIKGTLDIITGKMIKVNKRGQGEFTYDNLSHGDEVIICLNGEVVNSKITLAKIYKDGDELYAIQNVNSGDTPPRNDWQEWGERSWSMGTANSPGSDHCMLYKYIRTNEPLKIEGFDMDKTDDDTTSTFDFNLPVSSDGNLIQWSRYNDEHWSLYVNHIAQNWEQVENADFAIVIYLDKILQSDIRKMSDIRSERSESKKDALAFKPNEAIKNENIDRYLNIKLDRMGISSEAVDDLKNLESYISTMICGDYSFLQLYNNRPSMDTIRDLASRINQVMSYLSDYKSSNDNYYKRYAESHFGDLKNRYKRHTDHARTTKSLYMNSYKVLINNFGEDEKSQIAKEMWTKIFSIGSYINNKVKNTKINTLEDYAIMYQRLNSIYNLLDESTFRFKSNYTRDIIDYMRYSDSESDVKRYTNRVKEDIDIETLKKDLSIVEKIESFVKSIL